MDFAYLEGFVGGDLAIALEVLTLFREQAEVWARGLDPAAPDWRAAVHTVKGAALGIGARPLGDLCETAEFGGAEDLPAVRAELAAVLVEIAAYQSEKAGA